MGAATQLVWGRKVCDLKAVPTVCSLNSTVNTDLRQLVAIAVTWCGGAAWISE